MRDGRCGMWNAGIKGLGVWTRLEGVSAGQGLLRAARPLTCHAMMVVSGCTSGTRWTTPTPTPAPTSAPTPPSARSLDPSSRCVRARCDGLRCNGSRCDGLRCNGSRCDGLRCAGTPMRI
eukprot:1782999-Rhodomonas_salina.1